MTRLILAALLVGSFIQASVVLAQARCAICSYPSMSVCDWSLSQAKNPLCKERPKTEQEWNEREDKIWAAFDRWEEFHLGKVAHCMAAVEKATRRINMRKMSRDFYKSVAPPADYACEEHPEKVVLGYIRDCVRRVQKNPRTVCGMLSGYAQRAAEYAERAAIPAAEIVRCKLCLKEEGDEISDGEYVCGDRCVRLFYKR
jgi:hypothetical protein